MPGMLGEAAVTRQYAASISRISGMTEYLEVRRAHWPSHVTVIIALTFTA
jgi:hypothetical protein